MSVMRYGLFGILVMMLSVGVFAQDEEAIPESTMIEIEASDGLQLIGDFYLEESDEPVPALILLHMLNSNRTAYEPFIAEAYSEPYAILNVDMRGHGETGGSVDWVLAEQDVQAIFDWLREQEGIAPEQIAIVGASIGSNLAMIGCGNDAACVTSIALSPGLDYRGVEPANAIPLYEDRPLLIVGAQQDAYTADSVRAFATNANGNIAMRLYTGSDHGTRLFAGEHQDSVTDLILNWLAEHFDLK